MRRALAEVDLEHRAFLRLGMKQRGALRVTKPRRRRHGAELEAQVARQAGIQDLVPVLLVDPGLQIDLDTSVLQLAGRAGQEEHTLVGVQRLGLGMGVRYGSGGEQREQEGGEQAAPPSIRSGAWLALSGALIGDEPIHRGQPVLGRGVRAAADRPLNPLRHAAHRMVRTRPSASPRGTRLDTPVATQGRQAITLVRPRGAQSAAPLLGTEGRRAGRSREGKSAV